MSYNNPRKYVDQIFSLVTVPYTVFNILPKGSGGACTKLFTIVTGDRTGGNSTKLGWGRFRLDIRVGH